MSQDSPARGQQHGARQGLAIWGRAAIAGAAALLLGASLFADDSFLPPRSSVVLFSGLPGDVETETSYSQQMQGWLDWLRDCSPAPERVFVLADNTNALAAKLNCPVLFSAATREAWAGVARRVGEQTNPLTVVIWGHGGMQGRTPVFHVRGPRLTAADIKAALERRPADESRWILCFRGSGRFAKELVGRHRQILSSEEGAAFSNDPIALPLILKTAQAGSARAFVALAEQTGRAVAAWYEERNLARTEDPTLWVDQAEPRRLISSEDSAALASLPRQDANRQISSQPDAAVPLAEEPVSQPSGAWTNINRVEPRKYPDAEAVVLRRRMWWTLGAKPAISSEHEDYIQVLTAAGKSVGDFDVPYSPPQEELEILDCEVLLPGGKAIRLEKDEVREAAEAPTADYHAGRRKYFSMPGLVPGAILHLRYRREWQSYPMPHASLPVPLVSHLPIVEAALRISVPKESPFHFAFEEFPRSEPTVQHSGFATVYSWSFHDVPATAREPLVPPDFQPRLLVSTWPDWAAFAQWYRRLTQLTDELTPELRDKAKELTREAGSPRAKVAALYDYVTSLRYVMVPLGVNSFRPHAAATVFKNRFGDCKDKANLFNALLHALDIEACLVLVPRFSNANEQAPGLSFNHAISRVILEGQPLWIDTTDDACRFGMLPPGDAGRDVLVIDGQSTNLARLPWPAPQDHRLRLRSTLTLDEASDTFTVSFWAQAAGFPDYQLRGLAGAAGRSARAPLMAGAWSLPSGTFGLAKQDFTPPAQLDRDFIWQAEGQLLGLVSRDQGRRVVRAPFWLPAEWEHAIHTRTMPLLLNQGYPLTLDQTVEIACPRAAARVRLPSVRENSLPPLRWKIAWTQPEEGSVRAQWHLELAQGALGAGEAPILQQQLRQLLTALAQGASLDASP